VNCDRVQVGIFQRPYFPIVTEAIYLKKTNPECVLGKAPINIVSGCHIFGIFPVMRRTFIGLEMQNHENRKQKRSFGI
jgi:hypothetical protein